MKLYYVKKDFVNESNQLMTKGTVMFMYWHTLPSPVNGSSRKSVWEEVK